MNDEDLDEEQRAFRRLATPRKQWFDNAINFLAWVFVITFSIGIVLYKGYREWIIWTQ